ncbi:MAG: hypothetical protein AAGI23_16955 [Bacteroidota bacterium]
MKQFFLSAFVLLICSMTLTAQEDAAVIQTGAQKYTTTMNQGGQEMVFDVERSITVEDGVLVIVDKTATPFGNSENISRVNIEDNMTISQASTGFMTSSIDYSGEKITGETADMRGTKTPIDVEKGGVVYGGGSAVEPVLAALPMEIGAETDMKTFSVFQMNVTDMKVKVAAQEEVTVAGGTFDAYRLDISIPEFEDYRQSVWVTTAEPRMMVKTTMKLPQMEMATEYAGEGKVKKKKEKKKKN